MTAGQHGNGRFQCNVCGLYVWPITHSCTGIRVADPDGGPAFDSTGRAQCDDCGAAVHVTGVRDDQIRWSMNRHHTLACPNRPTPANEAGGVASGLLVIALIFAAAVLAVVGILGLAIGG